MINRDRQSFALDAAPGMVWKNIPDATSYTLKMMNQTDQTLLWEITVPSSDLMITPEGYYKYDYPTDKPHLEQDYIYLLTCETNKGTSILKGQMEVVLLEDVTKQAIEDFEALLDQENPRELEEKYFKAKDLILFFSREVNRTWRVCLIISDLSEN